jgi:hypothetical protein
MQVNKLADGLWTWTAEVGGDADAVCLYLESGRSVTLVDPLVPSEDRDRFLRALDKDVQRLGGDVHIALTDSAKREGADELAKRYGARIWAPGDVDPPPPGLLALEVAGGDTVAFWLPAHAALFDGNTGARTISGTTA